MFGRSVALALGVLLVLSTAAVAQTAPPQPKEWTVLVYVCGDNDLAPFALLDVNEMEVVGSTDAVDVVVQFDGSKKHSPEAQGSCRLHILKDEKRDPKKLVSEVVQDLGEVDMGSKTTLQEFLAWGVEKYPAKKTMLVLWNHGSGWYQKADANPVDYTSKKDIQDIYAAIQEIQNGQGGGGNTQKALAQYLQARRLMGLYPKAIDLAAVAAAGEAADRGPLPRDLTERLSRSICIDEGDGKPTSLSTTDVRDAIAAVCTAKGIKLEVLGADACLMAQVEFLDEVKDLANFAVVSEKTEPGDGWTYDGLLGAVTANPAMGGKEFGQAIVDTYIDHYQATNQTVENPFHKVNATLACVELSRVDAMARSIEALGQALAAKPELRAAYWETILNTQHSAEIGSTKPLMLIMNAHRDVIDLAQNLKAAAKDEGIGALADAVIAATHAAVVGFRRLEGTPLLSVKKTTGVAVYAPLLMLDPQYVEVSFGRGPWAEFLNLIKATPAERKAMIAEMQGNQKADKKLRKFQQLHAKD